MGKAKGLLKYANMSLDDLAHPENCVIRALCKFERLKLIDSFIVTGKDSELDKLLTDLIVNVNGEELVIQVKGTSHTSIKRHRKRTKKLIEQGKISQEPKVIRVKPNEEDWRVNACLIRLLFTNKRQAETWSNDFYLDEWVMKCLFEFAKGKPKNRIAPVISDFKILKRRTSKPRTGWRPLEFKKIGDEKNYTYRVEIVKDNLIFITLNKDGLPVEEKVILTSVSLDHSVDTTLVDEMMERVILGTEKPLQKRITGREDLHDLVVRGITHLSKYKQLGLIQDFIDSANEPDLNLSFVDVLVRGVYGDAIGIKIRGRNKQGLKRHFNRAENSAGRSPISMTSTKVLQIHHDATAGQVDLAFCRLLFIDEELASTWDPIWFLNEVVIKSLIELAWSESRGGDQRMRPPVITSLKVLPGRRFGPNSGWRPIEFKKIGTDYTCRVDYLDNNLVILTEYGQDKRQKTIYRNPGGKKQFEPMMIKGLLVSEISQI